MFLVILGLGVIAAILVLRGPLAGSDTHEFPDRNAGLPRRKIGFCRNSDTEAIEDVDDPLLLIACIATAFQELAGDQPRDQDLSAALSRHLPVSTESAEEMVVLCGWLVSECNGPQASIGTITKRLAMLEPTGFQSLLPILHEIGSQSGGLNHRQRAAIAEIGRSLLLE